MLNNSQCLSALDRNKKIIEILRINKIEKLSSIHFLLLQLLCLLVYLLHWNLQLGLILVNLCTCLHLILITLLFGLHLIDFGFDLRTFSHLLRILFVVALLAVGRILGFLGVGITALAFVLCFGCRFMTLSFFIVTWILCLVDLEASWIFVLSKIHQVNLICFFGVELQLDLESKVNSYQSRPQLISLYLVNFSLTRLFCLEYLFLHLGF